MGISFRGTSISLRYVAGRFRFEPLQLACGEVGAARSGHKPGFLPQMPPFNDALRWFACCPRLFTQEQPLADFRTKGVGGWLLPLHAQLSSYC
jgi:hypothetical protein